ncbi:histone-lysine N-methyltransferase trithorax isoform X2 [Cephus cinctus]|uniref:Histone-lysine N-methyltransferase trithorax n=1 Tax=Cephus cinctus TaxID=211228 RepID=A0AAJ7RVX7_CEPCN|nr:histone-lysine N-methyltransferase trithorax isoform X2 [Cephus cinctus]
MGRSKFPGKPPKTVTRKRIKVLGRPEPTQSDSVTVAENIYYGLSLFNETFGDNEKEHPPFHGFSSKEAKLSVSYVKTQQRDTENTVANLPPSANKNQPSKCSSKKETANIKNSSSDAENFKSNLHDETNLTKIEATKKNAAIINLKEATKGFRARDNKHTKSVGTSNLVKTPVLKSVNNILDRHQRTRQLRNSTAKRLLQRAKSNNSSNARNVTVQSGDKSGDKSGAVRKFVLPVRSAHSSRVIKPNKRFIEELEQTVGLEHSENENGKHAKKAKIAAGKLGSHDAKVEEENTNLLTMNLSEKEARKSKKLIQSMIPNVEGLSPGANCIEKSNSAHGSTIAQSESKKSQHLLNKGKAANKTSHSSNYANRDVSQKVATSVATSHNTSHGKPFIPTNHKQILVPIKVLPDSNVPISESSRVQTRSGTLGEASSSLSVQNNAESPPESNEALRKLDEKLHESTTVEEVIDDKIDKTNEPVNTSNNFDNFDTESTLSESGSEHSDHTEDEQSEWTGMKLNGGKVILRKARLKLDNKSLGGTEGPFSTTNSHNGSSGNSNPGLAGTVKCGVCGAVRFYRFVKQARKFGIHSCESCRKFISKMIKRQACAKSTNSTLPILQCHKGDGLCLVPPVVRSQQWNLMRCVYKARCPACWLKMCLKCYNMPSSLRTGLNALLPPLMRDPITISIPLSQEDNDGQGQKLTGCKIGWPAEDSLERNLFKSAISWSGIDIGQKPGYQSTAVGLLGKKLDKFDYAIPISPNKKRKKDNRIKVRKKLKNPSVVPSLINQGSQLARQRVELKGPRVKHVCRSASVALGQPVATFPSIDGKEDNSELGKNIPKASREGEKIDKRDENAKDKELPKGTLANQEDNTNIANSTIQQTYPKRGKLGSQQIVSASNASMARSLSKPSMESIHTISIDFWEQYDPAEVGTKGFALIGSELFHIPAICYLCGSAGKEPLIHCQCCCEPYHAFCLEPSEWNACAQPNWCCPRCTICQSCHLRSGPKLSCIRCRQSFHHSCLSKSGISARLYSPDRPYVCQSCVKCKSCGSEGVNVHVGNLPLCSMCFKLRQQGNYCPLCQRCYNENDFDTKVWYGIIFLQMMECNDCSCWVHARCEGLSDERYQILSYLPDSIEFTCRQCSPNPNSLWRNAIESELKAGFIAVIKSLSKNRKACAALKWSPRKECLCRPITSVRKLDFSDERLEICVANSKENGNPEESEDYNSDKFIDNESNLSVNLKTEQLSKSDLELEEQQNDGPRRGLRRLRQKFHLKECSVRVKNCIPKDSHDIEGKDTPNQESLNGNLTDNSKECLCLEQQIIARPSPTLMSVKRKVNGNEYGSLSQFHCDMEHVINRTGSQELIEAYHKTLQEVFPWFDSKHSKINSGAGGMSTPTKQTYKDLDTTITKLDDSILDTWKEEVLKAPKAIAAKTGNLYHNIHVEDSRSCCLCKGLGDGQETKEGRLLYCGQNEWVHSNCALWSNEVFEEIDGSLQNVHSAISRGRLIRCTECGKKGASVGCCSKNCSSTFHYPCARTIGLAFNDDKTVFCSLHLANCVQKTPHSEIDFGLKRPVYVELDRKKKKYAEPKKAKVMIGSLTIDCLGTIVPQFSDTVEKIIPSDYKCTRLYWSTVNPLKIVRYYIRTYVQVYVPDVSPDLENNITIDHSKERERENEILDREKIEQLAVKQTLDALIDSVCNKEVDENLAEQNNTDLLPPELKEAIFEDLPHGLLDDISIQDIFQKTTYEDFLAMDLKNDASFSSDLLKDDILTSEVEEIIKLPENKVAKMDPSMPELGAQNDFWLHLETKSSVQDLMDDLFSSKNQKLGGRELKRSKSEVISNSSVILGGQRHHQRSCSLTWSCKLDGTYGPTVKRRKLPRNSLPTRTAENVMMMDSQNDRTSMLHELRIPESIMLTVGRSNTPGIISDSVRELKCCIEDSNGINRRAIPPRDDTKEHKRLLWHTRQQPRILQVDGPADPSSASECSSPEYNAEERLPGLRRTEGATIPQLDGVSDDSLFDASSNTDINLKGNTDSKCKRPNSKDSTNPTTKYVFKIPQLDGADDISSDDECISPEHIADERMMSIPKYTPIMDPAGGPVTCKRCQCTYRTQDSYNRHLGTCDIMTTSDSDSETMDNKLASPDSRFSPSIGSMSPQFITMSPSEGHTLSSEYSDIQATSPIEASVPSPHPGIQIEPIAQAIITPQIHTHATVETVHQTVLTSNDMIVQTQYTRTTTTLPNATVLPQESTVQITEITDPPSVSSDSSISQSVINIPLTSPDSASSQTIPSPQISPTFSSTGVQTMINETSQPNMPSVKIAKPKSPRAPRPKAKGIKPHILRNSIQPHGGHVRFQPMQNNAPVIQIHQAQRPPGPTVILQQVASPNIMSAYVETLQQQSGQNLQYIATIGGQHEAGFKPQFIAANQLVPGAYIQASSDNLLTLQNGGISVLPSVQIAQPQPTVLGTIIQQQPSAIQCGVISSEQLVLSSTPALEMFTDSTGSMFVSSQPMYYGLETIVSNTVMSSSQFMAGAVPQVLASSYQTTTQVFQASKLMEPIVDVQAVPTVPTVPGVPGVPAVPSVPTVPSVPAVQAVQGMSGVHGSYVVVNQPTAIAEPMAPRQMNVPASPELEGYTPVTCNHMSPAAARCQPTVDQVRPIQTPKARTMDSRVTTTSRVTSSPKPLQPIVPTIPRVAVRPSPASHSLIQPHQGPWKITEPIFGTEQPISNSVRPYFDSKHVSENTSMIKSSISSKMPPLPNHCITQRNIIVNKLNHDVNNVHNSYSNALSNANNINVSVNNSSPILVSPSIPNKITMPTSNTPTSRPMNRVLPMQAVTPKQELTKSVEKPEIGIEELTKPPIKLAKPELEQSEKQIIDIIEPVKKSDVKENDVTPDTVKLDTECIDKVKENFKLDLDTKKSQNNTPLKLVLQKQLQDGSYKITHNMKPVSQNKKSPQVTSVEILPPKQAPQITSLQLLPIKTFTLKTNKIEEKSKSTDKINLFKPKPPPVAVKQPRIITKSMRPSKSDPPSLSVQKKCLTGPSLMYEIKSQDGFTHTASSMSEVWDKVFEAVQNARKALNLPPLPHNPLTENLGLENNATVYLVEQLPGVNRCTKYKPKFHNPTPPKPGEVDNDLLAECDSGAARAESFKERKVHDMFSWLASRHRQQPKMISISETESRRAASTNLPMAMRFRILKETSKESVGVYHSHIHGRGLFCLRDIEAGEMVIEYAGEVIRASLTDKREKYYDSKNIGCYMFKIDDHLVVDATMKGNAARFINHSCEPNCYSRVVDILGKKHILIFALRRIVQGEELTYDYKFPFEDIKIPCTCGSRRCRKYLN